MKKILFIIFSCIIIFSKTEAQISHGGIPYSFLKRETIKVSIPQVIMQKLNISQLLIEDSLESGKMIPWRFGKDIDVDYNLDNAGIWETLKNGDRLWRFSIKSEGALSLNFIFKRFRLPEGAKLFIYDDNRSQVLGSFTEQNNRDDGVFATTVIKGESAIFEYYEPADVKVKGVIELSKVIHAYKDIFGKMKSYGGSGSCNININCPEGAPWYNEKRAVAMILEANNTRLCTGALLNNAKEDGTPYFLTANHCTEGDNVNTWIFMFNYESPDCANQDGQTNQTLQGANLRASDSPSDFSLLELFDIPPVSYNVYYSGWSAVETAADSCVTIHHPSGDIKKISFEYETLVSTAWSSEYPDTHWTLSHWDKGTTEHGSSGAPLFDKSHKIIGQLHGGTASCISQTDDNFGKFSYSWNKGSTAATRLQNWLDPENTGTLILNGKDFNHPAYNTDAAIISIISPDTGDICQKNLSPTVKIQNYGLDDLKSLDIYYKLDNNAPVKYHWTGLLKYMNLTQITFSKISLANGSHQIVIYSENPNNIADQNLSNDTLKAKFDLLEANQVIINLKTDNYADETSWEIRDSKNNIVATNPSLISKSIYDTKICLNNGCYKFYLYDSYGDGICQGTGKKDSGYVNIIYHDSIIGQINGCKFDSVATLGICLNANNPLIVKDIFYLYPVLNNGRFTIDYNTANIQTAECIVYSVCGDIVARFPVSNRQKTEIDLKWLRSGVYFLSLNENSRKRVKKFIIAGDNK